MQKRRDLSAARSIGEVAKKIIFLALIVLVAYKVISMSFSFGRSIFYVAPAEESPGTDVSVVIEDTDDIDQIAEKLYYDGVITNTFSFKVQGTLYKTDFYPGEYELNTSMTIKELLTEISEQAEAIEESEAEAAASGEAYNSDEITGGYEGDGEDAEADNVDMSGSNEPEVIGGGSEGD